MPVVITIAVLPFLLMDCLVNRSDNLEVKTYVDISDMSLRVESHLHVVPATAY